ncbi:MAG: hypothetical protein J6V44_17385 [Methanobrevibacter sp.]|nr:hypothetical protein [Methanobrevibacter sp.]
MGKGRALCFVVVIKHEGKRYYLKSIKITETEGSPLPTFEGLFSPSLIEAKKFLKDYDAKFFATKFEGARVEIIKTGEVLK